MIGADKAVSIARARAELNGWYFSDPINCEPWEEGWFKKRVVRYHIETNAGRLGTKARFVIDAETGEVLEQGYIPR